MEKLKSILGQYGRWKPLSEYVLRIETYKDSDMTAAIENSKSLLESIAKEICEQRQQVYPKDCNMGKLLKLAFAVLGYEDTETITQVGGALANIAHQIGNLRNQIGKVSHGRTMDELGSRSNTIDAASTEFLVSSTEAVSCLLIQLFETEFPRKTTVNLPSFQENEEFNDHLDDTYGELAIGSNSYSASQILYSVNPEEYLKGLRQFKTESDGNNHRE